MTATPATATRRKVLVPLATLLVAGAVTVGSGATFTSQTAHSAAVTSGTLSHTNSQNGLKLNITGIKPGDTRSGTVTLTNDGNLDSTLALSESADSSGFAAGDLKLVISQSGVTTPLYTGDFGGQDNAVKMDLGALNVGRSTTVTFTVSMPTTAGNVNQGKSAAATYTYVTTQNAGDTGLGSWIS